MSLNMNHIITRGLSADDERPNLIITRGFNTTLLEKIKREVVRLWSIITNRVKLKSKVWK